MRSREAEGGGVAIVEAYLEALKVMVVEDDNDLRPNQSWSEPL